jgi:hypothetical protein
MPLGSLGDVCLCNLAEGYPGSLQKIKKLHMVRSMGRTSFEILISVGD